MKTHTKLIPQTITTSIELNKELEEILTFINSNRITGNLSKSKIIRIALAEWIEKQKKIQKILQKHSELNKSAEELLRENGYA
jgi:hypothetical protein